MKGILSRKVTALNQVLLNPKYSREAKIDAEYKLLAVSELLRDYPALDACEDMLSYVADAALEGCARAEAIMDKMSSKLFPK